MKLTTKCMIKVNGLMVANYQGSSTNLKRLTQDASHWISDTEFVVRASLKMGGCQRATIQVITDNVVIEHVWVAGDSDGIYGRMLEGKVIA